MSTQTIPQQSIRTRFLAIDLDGLVSYASARKLLTWSLSLTFFWFGFLKVVGMSPVVDLLKHSFVFLAYQPFLGLLGLFEVMIAIGLLIPRIRKVTISLTILHLLGTVSVVCISPGILFAPYFPVLTMEGEFILKNFILISACLMLLLSNHDPASSE